MTRATDRLEILDLIGRYSFGADRGQPGDYAGVFTADGEFVGRTGQPDEIRVSGQEKLTKFHRNALARSRANVQTRHHQSTTVFVSLENDRATTRSYLLTTTTGHDGWPGIGLTSVYEDDLVRTPDGWLIEQRRTLPDVKGTLEQLRRSPVDGSKTP